MLSRWDQYGFDLAKANAKLSKDPSTQVGAVILRPDHTVAATGFNGFPRGCSDDEHLYADRETKYSRIIHAEVNAILHARERLDGYTLYVWPFPPCDRCMAVIIQAGITRVVAPPVPETLRERWEAPLQRASEMALEAGVAFEVYADPTPVNPAEALRDMVMQGTLVAVDEASFRAASEYFERWRVTHHVQV